MRAIKLKNISLKRIPWRYAGAGALSAALLVASFPPYLAWHLAFVGMVPFLLAVFRARKLSEAFWTGLACMVCFILFGFQWISFVATNFGGLPWIVGKIVLVLFSLFAEAQYLFFALLLFKILEMGRARAGRRAEAWLTVVVLGLLPIVYVGLDFFYPKIFPSAFGHVLYGWFSVAQVAEYTGVYVLSLPIVFTNMALALLVHRFTKREKWAKVVPAVAVLVAVAVGLVAADRWGTRRIAQIKALEQSYTRKLKISIVQANIGDMDKLASENGFEPAVQKVLGTYQRLSLERVKAFHPDLIIWPETAFPFLYTHLEDDVANRLGQARDAWMYGFLQLTKTPLYFGTYTQIGRKDFNSGVLLEPPFKQTAVYRKAILLAFGEYVPLGPFSPIIEDLVPTIANFGRGPGPVVIDFKGIKLGPQICYEGIYPEHPRGAVRQGADILLNITNDSWFGNTTEPWLHLALTTFRSIELRRTLVRATNTGVSTIIDSTGALNYSTRLFEEASIDAELRAPGEGQSAPITFYARHGEILAQICAAIALLTVGLVVFSEATKKVRTRKSKS